MKVSLKEGPPDITELHVTKRWEGHRWRSACWLLLSYQISQRATVKVSVLLLGTHTPQPLPPPRCFLCQCPPAPSTAHSVTITLSQDVERLGLAVLLIARSIGDHKTPASSPEGSISKRV